ncbi:D-alanyl-D-alanine carboxypeptidase family protein [Planomonospora sp. ID67723]|uniref:M15 family metallopeptidase n=1 Tax=Planomonospora sp. ID67723 TaxID=2738134 RepID=UPI0018C43253|nr:M15 family metallopeptidase [Planomonospora sp. ID67723]MBG0830647.1 D-alanyl-D-alanine carboxypeptidase family protein [Planomonospora sp. ID67723]
MILLSDPAISRMPVKESGEALIDLRTVQALRVDPRMADPDGFYARLRFGVVDRLVTAQTLLGPGLRFLIIEGFRPVETQTRYFDAHVDRLRIAHPGRDEVWYRRRASRYISPPEIAPHVAGAAVDLTLCTTDGAELWMGTEVNDTGTEACHTASAGISAEAGEHRRILSQALSAMGLVNYPTEWWHWSYGDRYWAHITGAPAARYGPVVL